MPDRVLIAVNGSWLVLTVEQYAEAQAAGAELISPAGVERAGQTTAFEPLVDADTAAAQLGVTARWLEDGARADIVPHYRLGRFIRFRASEVAAHFRVAGAPVPTDSQSVRPLRRLGNQ
jgi:hypothetical protein